MKTLSLLALQNKHVKQQIVCKKADDKASIYMKGIISAEYGVCAADLRAALGQADGADVSLHINSPGGDVFEGREMQAVIASYPGKITAVIEGLAASAATFVAISCSSVQMLKGSRFMIHNGMTIAFGNKADMKSVYDVLEAFDNELAAEYAAKTKGEVTQMTAWMDAETWFTAEQALEHGFVDQINPNVQNVAAEWDLSAYAKAPPPPEPEPSEPEPPAVPTITAEHRERQQQRMRLLNHATRQ